MSDFTTAELFEYLNQLRHYHNMKPLKSWKESRAKLEAAVEKLAPNDEVVAHVSLVDEDYPTPDSAKTSTGEHVTLVQIAEQIGMNPKVARAKLRRNPPEAQHVVGKHKYHAASRLYIISLLRADNRVSR